MTVIKSIVFDNDGLPESVGMIIPLEVLAQITKYFGTLSGNSGATAETIDFYHVTTTMVFNAYWEGGVGVATRGR